MASHRRAGIAWERLYRPAARVAIGFCRRGWRMTGGGKMQSDLRFCTRPPPPATRHPRATDSRDQVEHPLAHGAAAMGQGEGMPQGGLAVIGILVEDPA